MARDRRNMMDESSGLTVGAALAPPRAQQAAPLRAKQNLQSGHAGELVPAQPTAWRRFAAAIAALATSFCFALYATHLNGDGHYDLGVAFAALSLLLAAFVAFQVVPYLARRSGFGGRGTRVEYELTREGGVYFVIIVLIAIASLNTGNNLLFIILAILLAGILASSILSKTVLSGIDLGLVLPEHVFAFESVQAQVTMRNKKRIFPSYSLTVTSRDGIGKRVGKRSQGASGQPEAKAAGNILTRPVYAPYISPQGLVTERVDLRFPRRGRYRQSPFQVSSKFPFSILRRKCTIPAGHEVLVLPSVKPAGKSMSILPQVRGEMESQIKGRGCDLYALRDYQIGDSARHVDWKATAKSQQLKVREFTREEETRLTIFFDAHVSAPLSAAVLGRFERAVELCACIAWEVCAGGSLLKFIGGGLETPMAPAADIVYQVLEALAIIEPTPGTDGSVEVFSSVSSVSLFNVGSIEGFPVIITDRPSSPLFKRIGAPGRIIAMEDL
ncbi:MAG: DUF58 domain-containing protein [Terriglobia bacterium]